MWCSGLARAAVGALAGVQDGTNIRSRRKDDRRNTEYERDGTYARGDVRRDARRKREEGYHSD